jgi:hypothetical protein
MARKLSLRSEQARREVYQSRRRIAGAGNAAKWLLLEFDEDNVCIGLDHDVALAARLGSRAALGHVLHALYADFEPGGTKRVGDDILDGLTEDIVELRVEGIALVSR